MNIFATLILETYSGNRFALGIIVFFLRSVHNGLFLLLIFIFIQLCSSTFSPHPALSVPPHQKAPAKMLDLHICFNGIIFIQSSTFKTLKTTLTPFSPSPSYILLVFIVSRSIPMCFFLTSFLFIPTTMFLLSALDSSCLSKFPN